MSRWDDDEDDWDDDAESAEDDDFEPPDENSETLDDDEPTIRCPYCRRPIHEDSQRCPHCERYISAEDAPAGAKPWWILVGAAAGLYAVYRWIHG